MRAFASFVFAAALLAGATAAADNVGRDAGKHFQRGVELYNDGDFRGALVEFKRAYALLPRANVLYDIGETELQLQDYASALTTMRRFLAETGSSAPHRSEVEASVEMLRGRVGRIALNADLPHCDVTIDEEPAGTTPWAEPMLASVGSRRIVVACPGRPAATRRVDVVAGELVRVDIVLGPPLTAALRPAGTATDAAEVHAPSGSQEKRRSHLVAAGWTTTALLLAATIGLGGAALVESSQLRDLRGTYPVDAATLDRKAALTRGLSIAADAVGAATLVGLGLSTYVTVKRYQERRLAVHVGVGPTSGSLRVTF